MDPEQLQRINKALADPRRSEILELIGGAAEMPCGDICSRLPVTQATVSHHLKELVTAGLVKERRESKFVFYTFQRQVWSDYLAEMRRRIPTNLSKHA